MNKYLFAGIITILLVTTGVLVAVSPKSDTTTNNTTTPQQEQAETVLARYTGNSGTYTHQANAEELEDALINIPTEDKKVLFFEGRTCPVCKELDKNIRAVDMPDNVHVLNVIADDNLDLMQKYQVRGTPSLYQIDNQGAVLNQLQLTGVQLDNILLQLI